LPNDAVVRIFFEDTPFDDFSNLVATIGGKRWRLGLKDKSPSIFPAIVPIGFYSQVVPKASVDFGFSWSSFNYLETKPTLKLDSNAAGADQPVEKLVQLAVEECVGKLGDMKVEIWCPYVRVRRTSNEF
jgi:hypothetical protein